MKQYCTKVTVSARTSYIPRRHSPGSARGCQLDAAAAAGGFFPPLHNKGMDGGVQL